MVNRMVNHFHSATALVVCCLAGTGVEEGSLDTVDHVLPDDIQINLARLINVGFNAPGVSEAEEQLCLKKLVSLVDQHFTRTAAPRMRNKLMWSTSVGATEFDVDQIIGSLKRQLKNTVKNAGCQKLSVEDEQDAINRIIMAMGGTCLKGNSANFPSMESFPEKVLRSLFPWSVNQNFTFLLILLAAFAGGSSLFYRGTTHLFTMNKFVHCKCRLCKNIVILQEEIGSGGFGKVYSALFNDEICVVKTLQIDNINDIQDAFDEATHVVKLRHPNVVAYKDVFFHRDADTGRDMVCIVMEFCDKGSLYDIVVNEGLNFNQFCDAIKQICQGLAFIHSENVLHCDVKLDNIFVVSGKDGYSFKLGDFGLATRLKHFTQNETLNSRKNNSKHVPGFISTIGGTPCYQAPELFENDRIISPPADLWGVGCLIYEAGTGLDVPDGEPYLGQRALHKTWNDERNELMQNLKSGLLRMCCQDEECSTVRNGVLNSGQSIKRPHSVPSTRLNVAQSDDVLKKKLTQDGGNRESFESRKMKDKEDDIEDVEYEGDEGDEDEESTFDKRDESMERMLSMEQLDQIQQMLLLFKSMLNAKPSQRLTPQEVVSQSFLNCDKQEKHSNIDSWSQKAKQSSFGFGKLSWRNPKSLSVP